VKPVAVPGGDRPDAVRRLRVGLGALVVVLLGGTLGYLALGFGVLDAIYQTVTTVTTVGYREVHPLSGGGKIFTIVLILVGVGTAAYTFSVLIETFVEGQVRDLVGRKRMERKIEAMSGHVIVCGWGRVGRAISRYVTGAGLEVVIVDSDPERIKTVQYPSVMGDATDDSTLRQAGIDKAKVLVTALQTDAGNLYVTLTARSLRTDLFIVARARVAAAEARLIQAGADRVVNPQGIGGARMAAFAVAPHVTEFLDVIMHDGSLEFRLEEVPVPPESTLAGATLREAQIRDRTGALVLAMRDQLGVFTTNPSPDTRIGAGVILIVIGTETQLVALGQAVGRPRPGGASGQADGH